MSSGMIFVPFALDRRRSIQSMGVIYHTAWALRYSFYDETAKPHALIAGRVASTDPALFVFTRMQRGSAYTIINIWKKIFSIFQRT